MHLHPFTIERLALELAESSEYQIVGTKLINAFTTDKETLFLQFDNLALKVNFFKGEALFQFPELSKLQKRNRLTTFKELVNLKVTGIETYPFERGYSINFENDYSLVFYLFGKFSQVALYQNSFVQNFPVSKKPLVQNSLSKLVVSDLDLEQVDRMRFLSNSDQKQIKIHILNANYAAVESILNNYRNKALTSDYKLIKDDKRYRITQNNKNEADVIADYTSIALALNDFSRLHISSSVVNDAKRSKLASLNQQIKKTKNRIKSLELKLDKLHTSVSNKEKADLIMANIYALSPNQKEYILTSFDGSRELKIKANAQLTPQANAERYYRKAKNQGKEITFVKQDVAKTKLLLEELHSHYENLESETDFKKLVGKKSESSKQKKERLPFRSRLIDGYEIRIGRSAADNDVLLRAHSSKNDLWLHAKGVSGSHVIIRNPNKSEISTTTIEKVASIAAFYSKAKKESLAAVIYTDRKFVRKPKGAHPGAVIVEREDMLLVEPENLST